MKQKLLFILLALLGISTAKAQCHGEGDQNPTHRDPNELPCDSTEYYGQISVDPNEIIGPEGYDSLRWVSIHDVLNYTIYFENDPEFATANAQRIDVRFNFGRRELMKDFTVGMYGFANMSWDVEKAGNTYQKRIDLVDSMGIYVNLIAGLDALKQQAFWRFSSIDPETGFAPWQHDRGVLPVNDSTHVGEGFVNFSIKPVSTMKTGDTISIAANIVFDENDTIPTNRWKNVVDAGTPTSRVVSRLDEADSHLYHLSFVASDDEGGSGVRRIHLYLANQFGVYETYAVCSPDSVLDISTEPGKMYALYSIAEDNVGNMEPLKESADVVLSNNLAPTDIMLSSTIFQDDIVQDGFIAEISSLDTEDNTSFTYALAEGEGAIHNEMFQISGTQLQAKECFKCAEDSVFKIRLSTTDEGGLSFSKAFVLQLKKVLIKPDADTLNVSICEGESYLFHGQEYDKAGTYRYEKSNEYMCDSVYILNLTLLPRLEAPIVTVQGVRTLVSSAATGNQWFRGDGSRVEGATGQSFTPEEEGVYYVAVFNGSCYSEPSQPMRVFMSTHMNLALDLHKGWNWVSSNLSESDHQNARTFLQPIEDNLERFVGITDELYNDPELGLTGNLETINPTEGYKMQLKNNVSQTWNGVACRPDETTVTLHKGWNWLGYLPICEEPLGNALSDLQPAENDVIKHMDDFSVFVGGTWQGSLTTLRPGEGYMYCSASETSFNYPTSTVLAIKPEVKNVPVRMVSPWTYDVHEYPDNSTLIVRLYDGESRLLEGSYAVAAFCNGECRGVGKCIDNLVFLTIHGKIADNEQITFKAFEVVTEQVYSIAETLTMNGQHVGTIANPFALHLSGETGIEEVASDYVVYPRPLRNRMYVKGDVDAIESIHVLSSNGVLSVQSSGYPQNGVDVSMLSPGVYVVAIITDSGKVYYEKVLKAQN